MSNRALLPFSKLTGLLSTVSSKLESAIVKGHRRDSLCCIILLSKHMIGYWFFVRDADLTESCPANDPGCQVLQVSLAFIPSPVFAARETCSKSSMIEDKIQEFTVMNVASYRTFSDHFPFFLCEIACLDKRPEDCDVLKSKESVSRSMKMRSLYCFLAT